MKLSDKAIKQQWNLVDIRQKKSRKKNCVVANICQVNDAWFVFIPCEVTRDERRKVQFFSIDCIESTSQFSPFFRYQQIVYFFRCHANNLSFKLSKNTRERQKSQNNYLSSKKIPINRYGKRPNRYRVSKKELPSL